MSTITYSIHDEPVPDDAKIVDTGLGDFNDQSAPLHEVQPLQAFARTASGEVIGGAVGRTWGECCELQQLWVHADHRRRGIATRLVKDFERRATQRGCRTFYLETFSFQAPPLYRLLGYEVRLETKGFAPGIVKYTMVREE